MTVTDTNNSYTLTRLHETAQRSAVSGFDPAKYRAEVDAFDITEEQKQELLLILWSIMRSFVELGFNVDVCSALLTDNTIPIDTELG